MAKRQGIRTNEVDLIELGVLGEVSSPRYFGDSYSVGADGVPRVLGGAGGVCYNVKLGDRARGWAADHVEPGASVSAREAKPTKALNILACIGNPATVVSGEAKGARGVVTGKHGGVNHVILDFAQADLDKLLPGDRVLVRARGTGLVLPDFPGVRVSNCDPGFLAKLQLRPAAQGRGLEVPIAREIPAQLMGSGLGYTPVEDGDYDIQLMDAETVVEYGLDELRLGDLVAIRDADNRYGRRFLQGAVSIGVVVHGDSFVAGHGPGVVSLLSSADGSLIPVLDPGANIGRILGCGRWRRGKRAEK